MTDGPSASASKSGAPDPLIGRVIAERFKIVSLIARGGMGKVYRAEQAPLGRACALKVLNPNYNGDADPEFHRRFFREASVASKITHPNSVTIFDYGKTDDDIYYMSMEYLEGQTLHQALRTEKTFHEDRVGRIAAQICRALREAHSLGVIHRDLKPANVFLMRHGDEDDFVKVLDFGLVKHIAERPEEQLTQTGLFMGSPKYMAPEQIQGAVVDVRTDIYSLGIIMYEMLAGKVPFDRATSVNILMAHVGEPPPPMREVNPNLVCTPPFEELVMRCIAKNPEERWASMDELLQAIKRAHGVALTGQLAAMTGVSGQFQSAPPPAVISSGPMAPVPPHVLSSGSQPVVLRSEASGSQSSQFIDPPRRSRAWIFFGVLVAAAIGGALGMAAFKMSAGQSPFALGTSVAPPVSAGPSAIVSASPTPGPSAVASASPPASASASVASVTMKVSSEPAGGSVKEDGVELCAATPCEIAWKGDDVGKVHKLLVQKAGFRAELRTVKASDGPIFVRLWRGGGGGPVRPSGPPATAKTSDAVPAVSGFKPAYDDH